MSEVQRVLDEIGAREVPQVLVFNKLDAVSAELQPLKLHDQYEQNGVLLERLFVSANTGAGLSQLRQCLAVRAAPHMPLEREGDFIPLEIPAQLPLDRP